MQSLNFRNLFSAETKRHQTGGYLSWPPCFLTLHKVTSTSIACPSQAISNLYAQSPWQGNKTFSVVRQCSSEGTRRFGETYRFARTFHPLLLVSYLAYSSTLKMEPICSSETWGSLQTTRRHNPEEHTLHAHHRENLKPNGVVFIPNFTEIHSLQQMLLRGTHAHGHDWSRSHFGPQCCHLSAVRREDRVHPNLTSF
jgi:hypothetical protein